MNHHEQVAARHGDAIAAFVQVARAICDIFEPWQTGTAEPTLEALRRLQPILAESYSAACGLPPSEDWWPEDDEGDEDGGAQAGTVDTQADTASVPDAVERLRASGDWPSTALMGRIDAVLADDAYYQVVTDPFRDTESIPRSLGDDLSSVYGWMREGLLLLAEDDPDPFSACCDWRFDFDTHVGEHVVGAITALYLLFDRRPSEA